MSICAGPSTFLIGSTTATEHDRADCLSNLRKCLTHRLKHFEEVYNLRQSLDSPKKRPYLEILANVGLVRPLLIQELLILRNDVEYNDACPPDTAKCRQLVDVMWYFLRSTDGLIHIQRTDVALAPIEHEFDSEYGCSCQLEYTPAFQMDVSGWFPSDLVSAVEKPMHIEVDAETFHTKAEKKEFAAYRPDRKDDDVWIIGKFMLRPNERSELLRSVLTAL